MKVELYIYFVLMLLGITSCNQHKDNKLEFTRDLPDFKNGKSLSLEGLSHSRDSLYLDTLENGYDSFQIRVWVTYSRRDTFQIISIKKNKSQWFGTYCEAALHFNSDHDSLFYYSKTEKILNPRSGWQNIVDSLLKLDILVLPDCTKIKGYDFPFDGGNSVTFEISTARQYRLYMYQLPSTYKSKFKETENVDKILKLLSFEFDIKYLDSF